MFGSETVWVFGKLYFAVYQDRGLLFTSLLVQERGPGGRGRATAPGHPARHQAGGQQALLPGQALQGEGRKEVLVESGDAAGTAGGPSGDVRLRER